MNSIIVTGATSMLGVALINECVKHGVFVTAIIRPNSQKLERLPVSKLIEIVECEISDLATLPNLVKHKSEIFFHLAWEGTENRDSDVRVQVHNIGYTLDAVGAAKKLGCTTFIGSGSQAEYGKVPSGKIGPLTSTNPMTPYGVCKYSAGKLAFYECEHLELRCIWARIFSVYGIYDRASSMINSSITKILAGEKTQFTEGNQMWDYLYSEDAGRALFLLGEKGKDKSFYCVGSGVSRPLREFIEILGGITNPKHDLEFGKISYERSAIMNLSVDIGSLIEDTGFCPEVNFREGITRIVQYKILHGK